MRILVVNDTSISPNQGCQATMHMFNRCIKKLYPNAQVKRILLSTTNYPYKDPPISCIPCPSNLFISIKEIIKRYVKSYVHDETIEYFLPSSKISIEQALRTILSTQFPLVVELREKVEWADLVIINGEGSVIEDQPNARFIFMVCELSAHYRKPCHLINFTAHITRSRAILLAKHAFQKCTTVSVREPLSYYSVKPFFPNVKLYPDIVAGFDVELPEISDKDVGFVMIGGGSATLRMEKKPSAIDSLKLSMSKLLQKLSVEGLKVKLIGWRRDEWLQDIQRDNAIFEMTDFIQYYNLCKNAIVNLTGRHHGCVMSFAACCPFITTTANCFKTYGDRLLYKSPYDVLELENFDPVMASTAILDAAQKTAVLHDKIIHRKKQLQPFIFGAFENMISNHPDLVDEGIIPSIPSAQDLVYKQNMIP